MQIDKTSRRVGVRQLPMPKPPKAAVPQIGGNIKKLGGGIKPPKMPRAAGAAGRSRKLPGYFGKGMVF